MSGRIPRTRVLRSPSVSPLHVLFSWLLTILALVVAASPSLGSPVPIAKSGGTPSGDLSRQGAPVCRATAPFLDPGPAWGSTVWGPTFWSPAAWGPTFGGYSPYSPYGRYGACSSPAALWGWNPYFSTPLLYVDTWWGFPYPLTLASRWHRPWRTSWMPWYSPYWSPYPIYCPPHARPRAAPVQASTVVDRPGLDGAADWVPGPEARSWNAVFAERREALAAQGLFLPMPLPRSEPAGTSLLTDRPVGRESTTPTPVIRRQPCEPSGWRSRPPQRPSTFSSSPRTLGGSPSVSRAPVQRAPARPPSTPVDRPRPQRE